MGQDQGKAGVAVATPPAAAGGAAAAAGGAAVPVPAGGYTLPPGVTLPPTAVAAGGAAAAVAGPATSAPPPPAAGAGSVGDSKTPALSVAVPPPFNRMDSAATAKALAAAVDAAAEGDTPLTPDVPPQHKRNVSDSDGALVRAAIGSPDSPAPIRSLLSRAVVTHDSPHIKTRRAVDARLSADATHQLVATHRFVEVRSAKAAGTTVLESQVTFGADGTCHVEHLSPSNGTVVQTRWGEYVCSAGGKVTIKLTCLVAAGAGAGAGAGANASTEPQAAAGAAAATGGVKVPDGVAILDEISAILSHCDASHPDLTVVARDDEAPDPLHALAGTRYRRV